MKQNNGYLKKDLIITHFLKKKAGEIEVTGVDQFGLQRGLALPMTRELESYVLELGLDNDVVGPRKKICPTDMEKCFARGMDCLIRDETVVEYSVTSDYSIVTRVKIDDLILVWRKPNEIEVLREEAKKILAAQDAKRQKELMGVITAEGLEHALAG